MAAAGADLTARLRRALVAECPAAAGLDDSILLHLAGPLSAGAEAVSAEAAADVWSPFLTDLGACRGGDASAFCGRVLARLRGGAGGAGAGSAPSGAAAAADDALPAAITQWLEQLKLIQYAAKAKTWCNSMGAVHVSEILENLEDFKQALQLKPLEYKRLLKAKDGDMPGGATAAPKAAPVSPSAAVAAAPAAATAATAVAAATAGPQQAKIQWSFGPSSDPDKYGVVGELGQGATATVYECISKGQVFAAKTIGLSRLRLQPGFQRIADSMKREVQILRLLRHPRIVSLFEVIEVPEGTQPDKLILIMELVVGRELFDKIVERGALKEHPVARYVFIQITEGLQYIHSKDIVYRDLKPENILVDEKKSRGDFVEIKLSDFGHSKLINDGYSTALTKVGTPQYWAPEVSECDRTRRSYTQAVDLWSLGVVLFVMVIGRYPFDGQGSSIDQQIRTAQVMFPISALGTELTEPAKDLIRSLIKVNPLQRLSLGQCLKHRWVAMEGQVQTGLLKLATEGEALEERILLPYNPSEQQRQQLKRDLDQFMSKFRCAVRLKRDDSGPDRGKAVIVADMHQLDAAQVVGARQELLDVLRFNLNAHVEFDTRTRSGGSGAGAARGGYPTMPAVRESEPETRGFRILNYRLRVHKDHGAGVQLNPEHGGMRIEEVESCPGQPGLRANDLIIKINEVPLRGDPSQVEDIFGTHFGDGVQLAVKRG